MWRVYPVGFSSEAPSELASNPNEQPARLKMLYTLREDLLIGLECAALDSHTQQIRPTKRWDTVMRYPPCLSATWRIDTRTACTHCFSGIRVSNVQTDMLLVYVPHQTNICETFQSLLERLEQCRVSTRFSDVPRAVHAVASCLNDQCQPDRLGLPGLHRRFVSRHILPRRSVQTGASLPGRYCGRRSDRGRDGRHTNMSSRDP